MPQSKVTMVETFAFSAAHHLPTFPDGHKCRRLHGHTWLVEVHVEVDVGPSGYACDHADIAAAVVDVLRQLDHRVVNDVAPELARGLAEDILAWLVTKLQVSVATYGTLTCVALDEMSGGGPGLRLTHHRKVWNRGA